MITVIGDIHGQIDPLCRILREARFISAEGNWSGGEQSLWFLGDYFDRGPDGIAVIDLIMRLQRESAAAGGHVGALLGNHDVILLAVALVEPQLRPKSRGMFHEAWLRNGGLPSDLERLEARHINWLKNLPAMAVVEDNLLIHADALFYQDYGLSSLEVNGTFRAILAGADIDAWDALLDAFSQRRVFFDKRAGEAQADDMLRQYGGRRLIHGHTPITKMTGEPIQEVREAFVYAGGRCVNVDHGLYLGGPGFVTHLDLPVD
jgi:fructose-1,6-bisphosphatase